MTIAFLELLRPDRLLGDLAQGNDRVLVAVAIDGEVGAAGNLTRALSREQDEVEPVRDLVNAIFNRNARHSSLRKEGFREAIWDVRKAAPIACGLPVKVKESGRMADDVASCRQDRLEAPIEAMVDGNRLIVLETGEGRLRALLDLIAGARTSVRVLFYIFNADWAGRLVRDALVEAAAPGRGGQAAGRRLRLGGARQILRRDRRRAAARFCLFNPSYGRRYLLRNHQKLAIADDSIAHHRRRQHRRHLSDRRRAAALARPVRSGSKGPRCRCAANISTRCSAGAAKKNGKLRSLRRLVAEHSQWRGPLQWKFSGPLSMRNSWWRSIGGDLKRGHDRRHDLRLFRSARRDASADRRGSAARGRARIITVGEVGQ